MNQVNFSKWLGLLPETATSRLDKILRDDAILRQSQTVFPSQSDIFRALTDLTPEQVRVVIVGQDPYHGPGQANGRAFAVPNSVPAPPSLNSIKQLLSKTAPVTLANDLSSWANQGVLLLNASLTVLTGRAGSLIDRWRDFTQPILEATMRLPQPIMYLGWGKFAQEYITTAYNTVLNETPNALATKAFLFSSHPSPYSAYKPCGTSPAFMMSDCFNICNQGLISMGAQPVNFWR